MPTTQLKHFGDHSGDHVIAYQCMFVLLLWIVIATGLLFLLLAIWLGCGTWSLIR